MRKKLEKKTKKALAKYIWLAVFGQTFFLKSYLPRGLNLLSPESLWASLVPQMTCGETRSGCFYREGES